MTPALKAAAQSETLTDIARSYVWALYNAGIEENGFWIDGGPHSDGAALRRLLQLGEGRHDAEAIKERLPALADQLCVGVAADVMRLALDAYASEIPA